MCEYNNLTGYGGPASFRGIYFDGSDSRYELWEVKFLAYLRSKKLYDTITRPIEDEVNINKNAEAFSELVQFLDDRSLSLIIRDANNDGRKALNILRQHYLSSGAPRIISLYTELTTLEIRSDETTTDYLIRAENAATFLKNSGEHISDYLLIAMCLKGLPSKYDTLKTVVTQRDIQMTFSQFKSSLRNFEETNKPRHEPNNAVMNVNYEKLPQHTCSCSCQRDEPQQKPQ